MPRKRTNRDNICSEEAGHKQDDRLQTAAQKARNFYFKVCRVCLATRVKMHNITEQGLGDMYKQVTGIEINNEDNLPQVLCWECVARLSNASNFIEKALRTRWILTNNGESLTINKITSMNKTEYGLNSTLGYKFFYGNYVDLHIIHDMEADSDVTSHINNNKGIDEADVDRGAINSIEIFTSVDQAHIATYKEAYASNDSGIKSEPRDINIDLVNEVNIKEERFSDEEMIVDSNNEMLQEPKKKELELNDNATSEDNNENHTLIIERIKFEDNVEKTSNTEDGSTNNSNPNEPGNTSMYVKNKMQYTCDICNKTFICKSHIARHLENHPEIFSCSLCAYKTSHKDHLTIHTTAEHSRAKELRCSFCSYTTHNKSTLQEHTSALHIKKSLYSCTHCAFKSNNKSNVNRHIASHHTKPTTLDCSFCDFKTLNKVQLLEHINIRHTRSVSFICSFCNFKTYDKNSLSSHINAKHIKSTIYKCSYCSFVAYDKYQLTRHVKTKHK